MLVKLAYTVPENTVKDIVVCKADVIEVVLINLRSKVGILYCLDIDSKYPKYNVQCMCMCMYTY